VVQVKVIISLEETLLENPQQYARLSATLHNINSNLNRHNLAQYFFIIHGHILNSLLIFEYSHNFIKKKTFLVCYFKLWVMLKWVEHFCRRYDHLFFHLQNKFY